MKKPAKILSTCILAASLSFPVSAGCPITISDITPERAEGNVLYFTVEYTTDGSPMEATDFVTFSITDSVGDVLTSRNVIFPTSAPTGPDGKPIIYRSQLDIPAIKGMSRLTAKYRSTEIGTASLSGIVFASTTDSSAIRISVRPERAEFPVDGGYCQFSVMTNASDWDVTLPSWLTVASHDAGSVTLKAEANTQKSRNAGIVRINAMADNRVVTACTAVVTQNQAASSPGHVDIRSIRIRKNADLNGVRGLKILIRANVYKMFARKAVCRAELFDRFGNPVMAPKGSKYANIAGQTTAELRFEPKNDYDYRDDILLFIPNEDIAVDLNQKHAYYMRITFEDTTQGTKVIGRMDYNYIK